MSEDRFCKVCQRAYEEHIFENGVPASRIAWNCEWRKSLAKDAIIRGLARASTKGHAYKGSCPDSVNEYKTLDPRNCELCAALAMVPSDLKPKSPGER